MSKRGLKVPWSVTLMIWLTFAVLCWAPLVIDWLWPITLPAFPSDTEPKP